MDINKMDADARKANFLVSQYNTGELYYRQLTPNIAIFVERDKGSRYICHRLKWENKPAAGVYRIQDEKFYCSGTWKRCFRKARGIVKFWEENILK